MMDVKSLESIKESLEKAGKILDLLEKNQIPPNDVYLALPTFIAILATGIGKNKDEAIEFIDLLANSTKEAISFLFECQTP